MTRALIATAVSVGLTAAARAETAVADPRFEITTVATGLVQPTALAYDPAGRLFVTEKAGTVRTVSTDGTLPEFAHIEVLEYLECGLLGVAVDPDFARNGFVYLFATVSDEEQQIIRLRDEGGVGVDPTIVRRFIPSQGSYHNGGCLRVGPDGKLYFSVGDNTEPSNAQDLSTLAGKISRINLDGTTPTDNPFTTALGSPRAIFALGFRNPFRFCFAPDGRMFACDVGSDNEERREEINLLRAADNAGWPAVEGIPAADAVLSYRSPIYAYHDEGSAATGIVYYDGESYPPEFRGNLFQLEYSLNRIYRVVLDGDALASHTLFAQTEGGPVDIVQAPDGSLVYCELVTGEVKRIRSLLSTSPMEPIDDGTSGAPGLCGMGSAGWPLLAIIGFLGHRCVRARCRKERRR